MPTDSRLLRTIHANQLVMIGMLKQLLNQESEMAIDLTKLAAEVENNSTVEGSVLTLLKQLQDIITNIPPSTDPVTQAALDDLVGKLAGNDQVLADAVKANTPQPPAP